MSTIRYELVHSTANKVHSLIDYNIHTDIHKQYEFQNQTILSDKLLTDDEKVEAIKFITKTYDREKILNNTGTKRTCENCKQECLATSYCEYCIRNYLKGNFSKWTSGNKDIDNLIQNCQMETLMPNMIIEWIPYNNLEKIKFLAKDSYSEIYTANWTNGCYDEWDSKKRQLKRVERPGIQKPVIKVVLKKLENIESANKSWFDEAKSHLTISNKCPEIARCCGLTQDTSNGNYMLVMMKMDMDLRNYLQQSDNQLTWKERIRIAHEITEALYFIHLEKVIHKDLHSGNILYKQHNDSWYISDLGFCGPANKSQKSIYGNLPYIAPEVICGKGYTFASDIYSVAMLMWEISSGYPPFIDYKYDDDNLAIDIVNGMRPKIVSEIPLEYKSLMQQCWDADPSKRPDIQTIWNKINEIHLSYQSMSNAKNNNEIEINPAYTSCRLFTSKVHEFENLPEPKNATEEEQEAFYSKLQIPDIDDNSNDQKNKTTKMNNIFRASSKRLSKVFKKLQMNSKNGNGNSDIQDDDEKETIQQQMEEPANGDDKLHNSPSRRSEEKGEIEIPDDGI